MRFCFSPLDRSQRLVLAGAVFIGLVSGCDGPWRAKGPDPTASLSSAERVRLDSFIGEIRRAYEMGNSAAVEAHINREGTPDFLVKMTRRQSMPKGPMKVLDARVESRIDDSTRILTFDEVDYGFNVDPIGVLLIEMDDVSIGKIQVDLIIGRKNEEFFIAGLRPLE